MTPRRSLPWGVVGGLSFLVLLQGFELITGARIDLAVKFGVALLVTAGAAALAYVAARRLPANGSA